MKVFVVLLFVAAALAAPQEVEDAAELVPGKTVPGPEGGDGGVVFVVPGYNPFTNFFRNIFRRRPTVTEDGVDIPASGVAFDTDRQNPRGPGGFLSFIDSLFRLVPSPSQNSTITFQNSTIEVVNIGGIPMQVNRTIVERTDEDGSIYRRVDQRIVGIANSISTSIPADGDEINEVEIEPSNALKHHLQKRWITSWLQSSLRKRKAPSGTVHNHLPGSEHLGKEEEEERAPDTTHYLVPIRNEDDIAVNYLGVRPPINPDAEVFDADLMEEAERNFWEARGNSVVSRPMMSRPLRSQPMMSQPLRSQPMMSQPLRSHPVMSQPLRSAPVMSQPLRSHPVMSQPLRSHPVMSQPLRSHPVMSQPLRSAPVMSQPLRSHPVMSQPLRSHPVMSQPLRSEPMTSQPLRTRHVRL